MIGTLNSKQLGPPRILAAWRMPTPSRLAALLFLLGAATISSACKKSPVEAAPQKTQTAFALQATSLPNLVSVDWDFKFWFLDATPPEMYNDYPVTSAQTGGHVDAVLPCLTGPSGTGQNQVIATAQLWFAGQTTPAQGTGSALFTCRQSLDTPINIVVNVTIPSNVGFVDPTGVVTGVGCSSKIDWKDDSWLAVCSDSSCGDSQAVFVFANACQQLDGTPPSYWACGPGADWTLSGILASCQFAIPPGAGNWNFGISALPQVQLSPADPTLTDSSGNLLVFSNVPTPLASLQRSASGPNTGTVDTTRVADFAADLTLAANAVGGPSPHQLLEVRNTTSGAVASAWLAFGPCDPPVQGTQSWPGLYAVDVRLSGAGAATVVLAPAAQGAAASGVATCTAQWASDQVTPQVSCSAVGALP